MRFYEIVHTVWWVWMRFAMYTYIGIAHRNHAEWVWNPLHVWYCTYKCDYDIAVAPCKQSHRHPHNPLKNAVAFTKIVPCERALINTTKRYFISISEFRWFTVFSCTTTKFLNSKRRLVCQKWWDIRTFRVFCLEWRFVALDGHSDFYVELSLFNSGKVTAKNYNYRPQCSCCKVMFSLASVILITGGGACVAGRHVWQRALHGREGAMHGRKACIAGGVHDSGHARWGHVWWGYMWRGMRSRRNSHCSGQYASYWNAFLFHLFILNW